MTALDGSEEEDITGFDDCNKDTVRKMVKKKKKLDLSNPEYEKVRCG
jgi:hypothetical protein